MLNISAGIGKATLVDILFLNIFLKLFLVKEIPISNEKNKVTSAKFKNLKIKLLLK